MRLCWGAGFRHRRLADRIAMGLSSGPSDGLYRRLRQSIHRGIGCGGRRKAGGMVIPGSAPAVDYLKESYHRGSLAGHYTIFRSRLLLLLEYKQALSVSTVTFMNVRVSSRTARAQHVHLGLTNLLNRAASPPVSSHTVS